ncbi:hypothetical protein ACWD4G_34295 [Streptomyces sp. NPDC002643]
MRTRTSLSACALLLGLTLTACGDDELSLPMAQDVDGVAQFLDKNLGCADIDYYGQQEVLLYRAEVSYAIESGGECDVDESTDIEFLTFTEMNGFQKDLASSDENDDTGLMVGMDFVVDADDDDHARALLDAGLLYVVCDPGVVIPETYKQYEGEAGCVMTDYPWEAPDES